MIQIFFHNHGLYIINKDSCEHIHQILIEKFTFNFLEGNEFFEKAIKDQKSKDKNKKILINDFKLKNIIEKNNTVDLIKSQRNMHNDKVGCTLLLQELTEIIEDAGFEILSSKITQISGPQTSTNFKITSLIENRF